MPNIFGKIKDTVQIVIPRAKEKIVYATPPENSFDSRDLLDLNKFRNFQDSHGVSIISFSQHGQDKIVEAVLRRCGITKPTYLDIGCNFPIETSNTALFYRNGSYGIVVDANENHRRRWSQLRPMDTFVNAAVVPKSCENIEFYMIDDTSGRNSADYETVNEFIKEVKAQGNELNIKRVINVKALTINEIVDTYCSGIFPDYLSIDIEGLDLKVLESADFSISAPKVISIEIGGKGGRVIQEKGFTPVLCTGADIVAVHNDYISFIAPWSK
jgi:FkbM family methyltransferase